MSRFALQAQTQAPASFHLLQGEEMKVEEAAAVEVLYHLHVTEVQVLPVVFHLTIYCLPQLHFLALLQWFEKKTIWEQVWMTTKNPTKLPFGPTLPYSKITSYHMNKLHKCLNFKSHLRQKSSLAVFKKKLWLNFHRLECYIENQLLIKAFTPIIKYNDKNCKEKRSLILILQLNES